ncbi:MAG: capsular polysaccharide biosynthesis protein [Paracoccaceae bacterium]
MKVAVWGRLARSRKARKKYRKKTTVLTFEDAFLRSVLPGPKTPPIGITIDDLGIHFDCSAPSRLEHILQHDDLDDPQLLQRARDGRAFLRHYGLSKYNPTPLNAKNCPPAGYILVVDQVAQDASIIDGNASAETFTQMLTTAKSENPGQRIIIRTHPAIAGKTDKIGHFTNSDEDENVTLFSTACNPYDLLDGATKVYCVTSQFGFEAILTGHRPVVFGLPFYAGWGLSDDRQSVARRTRNLNVDQLFAAAMLVFPHWFDRTIGKACTFEQAARQLHVESRHYWDGITPKAVLGMHIWKRNIVAAFLNGAGRKPVFCNNVASTLQQAQKMNGEVIVWAAHASNNLREKCKSAKLPLLRMEDGFLRSTGLGADLTPASSLVLDDLGIYYDAQRPSRLEALISEANPLPEFAVKRAQELHKEIVKTGVSKYNLGGETWMLRLPKDRNIILLPGQVEDDASIKKGAGDVHTNLGLLKAARMANPKAYIIYKPHPDVSAGLRKGKVAVKKARLYCDRIVENVDPICLIERCDEVWTITSLLGFEALLRGKKVTCFGMPFYAGWGLTIDLGVKCARRASGITIEGLIHATLIDYPRYMDPVSGLPCTPEVMVERLAQKATKSKPMLRVLAKLQGILPMRAFFWR